MISLLASHNLKAALSLTAVVLAQAATRFSDATGIGTAILLTVTGIVLHWNQPHHRMSMEERIKDGKLTDDEARRRIRIYSWCASIPMVTGILLLLVVMYDLTR